MAEILVLPLQPYSSDRSTRLHAELAAAHARGANLGPRAPHIQADGERLLGLSHALEHAIVDLDLRLIECGLQDAATLGALRSFVSAVESLARTAQRFPPTH